MEKILVANRGEIAIRIIRAARQLGFQTLAVYAPDDSEALHVSYADDACELPGEGAAAYLDIGAMVAAAQDNECWAIHPGYGFLSENGDFARRCED